MKKLWYQKGTKNEHINDIGLTIQYKNVKCAHNNDYTNTKSISGEWIAAQETIRAYFLSKLSILLVNFSIQIARVNSIQAEVRLIQLLCGKYLQAHSLPCKSWTSEHLPPIITCNCKTLEHWHKYLTWWNDKPWRRTTLWMQLFQMRKHKDTYTLSEQGTVYRTLESNQNFSEITTGLSRRAYGSSPLK